MPMSTSCKQQIFSTLLGQSQNISIASGAYIGLLTSADVSATGDFQEVAGAGYERVLLGHYQNAVDRAMGSVDSNGTVTNIRGIVFQEADEDWGTITHFALYSSKSGGTPYLWGELSAPVEVKQGYVPMFKTGRLKITLA